MGLPVVCGILSQLCDIIADKNLSQSSSPALCTSCLSATVGYIDKNIYQSVILRGISPPVMITRGGAGYAGLGQTAL